jgi:hypothetical protein
MDMRTISFFAVFFVALALVGCGGKDEPAGGGGPVEILVEDAGDHEGPAIVTGSLLANGDDVRLCAALAESFPPQCGGGSIVVVGLDLDKLDGLTTEGDVTWSDLPISVEGVLADGTLTVDENAVE